MNKQQFREALRKIIKEELGNNEYNQFLDQFDIPDSDEAIIGDIIGQIEGGEINEIALGKTVKNLTIGGLIFLSSILGAKAQAPQKNITSYNKIELLGIKDSSDIQKAKETFGNEIGKLVADAGLKPLNDAETVWGIEDSEVFGGIGLTKKDDKIRYINLKTGELGDPVGLGQEVESWIKNNYLKRINTLLPKVTPTSAPAVSIKETIRRIIKQELKEMWSPEPEVADPDVEIEKDPLISPDEDEDDLRFPAPKGDPNPKAEREMIKKIIDRYNSLTEKKYK